ncbi:MAG TPA: T9SS type A sorting domain-containing protein [Flavobacteriales bacterium]|nr:T9SS type A sorting domain-containing protein [Flavobacteriales bacterium]HMR29140.1 T9SS type A sorting domain-containing protein [Flavobacteriales bacterium]
MIAGVTTAQAQRTSWVQGNEVVVLTPGEPASTFALPQPNDPNAGADQYSGGAATTSAYVQLDDLGCILFFAVDGDLYDRNGYRITQGGDLGCSSTAGCLLAGSTELIVAPVPGRCGHWYLFHSIAVAGAQADPVLHVSVLDMTLQNPAFPNDPERRGRVLDDTDLDAAGYDLMFAWPYANPIAVDLGAAFADLWGAGERCLHMDAVRSEATGRTFLFASNGEVIARYELTSSSILLLGSQPVDLAGAVLNPTARPRVAKGELEAVAAGSTVRVAFSITLYSDQIMPPPPDYNAFLVHVAAYDAALPTVPRTFYENVSIGDLLITAPPAPTNLGTTVAYPGAGGVEFTADGALVYWSRSLADHGQPFWDGLHHLGYFDWATLTTNSFPTIALLPSVDSELELAPAPDGIGLALYMAGTDDQGNAWLSALAGPDDPNTATWLPQAITVDQASLCADPSLGWNNVQDRYHLLQAQGYDDASLEHMSDPVCCQGLQDMTCTVAYAAPVGAGNWTPTVNPFCDKPVVRICEELRLPAGAHITAQDLTFAFSTDAALVIEPGASLTCTNCTFTSACEGEWWKGIRVEGTTSDGTQSQQYQGRLSLWSSEVRNAVVGVWCARELTPNASDPDHYGGRVFTSNSTFRNNITGVRIERFHRIVGGNEFYNLCTFSNTEFITDADWPDMAISPLCHARLTDVNGVRFGGCAFRNNDHTAFQLKRRGWGIYAFDATFTCKGGMNYADHTFDNLSIGVLAFAPDMTKVYEVDGMGFHNNAYYGLIDFQGRQPVVTNNEFHTLTTDVLPGGTASCGMYLWSSEGYTVERNTFLGDPNALSPTVGIWFRGPAVDNNQIYDNDFDGLTVATSAYGNHVGPSPPGTGTKPGLQWLCGDHGQSLDNTYDQIVLPDQSGIGNIQADQGDPSDASMHANNRYFSARPCQGPPWDIYVEPLLDPGDVDIQYFYFQNTNNPEMRPKCIHDLMGNGESFVDEYYDLVRVDHTFSFDPEVHCDEGYLDELEDGSGGHVFQLNEYQLRLQELASAVAQYLGNVDGGDKPDLLELIHFADPWHPSHVLRDEMLQQSPLSDEVLLAAIWREVPMDPWHLTQVLIGNSELTNEVWRALEESQVLTPFFLAMIDHYQGQQSPRAIYEQEIALRLGQKSRLQHRLLRHYAQDTLSTGDPTDSMDVVLAMDPSPTALMARYWMACSRYDEALAAALTGPLQEVEGTEDLIALGEMLLRAQGNWSDLEGGDLQELENYAFVEGRAGSAAAWAVQLGLADLDSLPPALIPAQLRTLWEPRRRSWAAEDLILSAYPNPANDRVMVTLPTNPPESQLTIYDAQGRLMITQLLKPGMPFLELNVRNWSPGLYLGSLSLDGFRMAEVKFNIVR